MDAPIIALRTKATLDYDDESARLDEEAKTYQRPKAMMDRPSILGALSAKPINLIMSSSEASSSTADFERSNRPETLNAMLEQTKNTKDTTGAKVVLVGGSPTGGGHLARLFAPLERAAEKDNPKNTKQKLLPAGSTVIIHCPEEWQIPKVKPVVLKFAQKMSAAGINVFIAEASNSAFGFLREKGESIDSCIAGQFSRYPLRPELSPGDAMPEPVQLNNATTELGNLQAVDAHSLMSTVTTVFSTPDDKNSVYVLSDMDPYLQKAALSATIPEKNRVDQQNHGIMLDTENTNENLLAKNAYLAKVLGGTGEHVSHIELGEKNTLGKLAKRFSIAPENKDKLSINVSGKLNVSAKAKDEVAIDPSWSKERVRMEVARYLLNPEKTHRFGDIETYTKPSSSKQSQEYKDFVAAGREPDETNYKRLGYIKNDQDSGIICRPGLNEKSAKNIVYIYANKNTREVADAIKAKVDRGDESCKETLFVVCGASTFKAREDDSGKYMENENALHLAYLADADGITTAGAGTAGEFAYLHRKGGSKANVFMLPIHGHNEQAKNAEKMEKDYGKDKGDFVTVFDGGNDSERLSALDGFINSLPGKNKNNAKYGPDEKISTLCEAVKDEKTAADHTCDLLFGIEGMTDREEKIRGIEIEMRGDENLEAARHQIKVVFQAFDFILKSISGKQDGNVADYIEGKSIDIAIKNKSKAKFGDWGEFVEEFRHQGTPDSVGQGKLVGEKKWTDENSLLNEQANKLFARIADLDVNEARRQIRALAAEFGGELTTGF